MGKGLRILAFFGASLVFFPEGAAADILYAWGVDKPWFRLGIDVASPRTEFIHTTAEAIALETEADLQSDVFLRARYSMAPRSWFEFGLSAGAGKAELLSAVSQTGKVESVSIDRVGVELLELGLFAKFIRSIGFAELFLAGGPASLRVQGDTVVRVTDLASAVTEVDDIKTGEFLTGYRAELGTDVYWSQNFSLGFSLGYLDVKGKAVRYKMLTPGLRMTYLWGSPSLGAFDDGTPPPKTEPDKRPGSGFGTGRLKRR